MKSYIGLYLFTFAFNTLFFSVTYTELWYSVVPGTREEYRLYMDVCVIPSNMLQFKLLNVSRAVCRLACSETYEKLCSGFLYSRRERGCTLTPYTGERIPASATDCNSTMKGLEFYRRSRLL